MGVSLNLNDTFFLGLDLGREYLSYDPGGGGDSYDTDRAVQNYGLAFRKGGQGTTFHLEYYVVRRDPFKHAGAEFNEQDQNHIVVELNWSSILLSAHWVDFTVDKVDGKTQSYVVGWAPKKGLAVLGQYETTHVSDSGTKLDADTTTISLAYQF